VSRPRFRGIVVYNDSKTDHMSHIIQVSNAVHILYLIKESPAAVFDIDISAYVWVDFIAKPSFKVCLS
jgi:hypothetical protein